MLLKDKVALITAGASGMGRAGAERFAAEGAHVIVVDFNEANAKETVDGIVEAGGSAAAEICDVRDLPAPRGGAGAQASPRMRRSPARVRR